MMTIFNTLLTVIEFPSYEEIQYILKQLFFWRGAIAGILISCCAALLGVGLVLKRYSMIGDGLSHVSFSTFTLAVSLGLSPLQFSIPVILIAAFLLLKINENGKIKGDAAIAIISISSLAIGLIIVSYTTKMNADVSGYLFGSVLLIKPDEFILIIIIAIIILLTFILFYNKLFAVTFDANYSKAVGIKTSLYNFIISSLTALIIVIGIKAAGAMLISGLLIFPPLIAMRIFKSYLRVTLFAAIISIFCYFIGYFLSIFFTLPPGASVIVLNLIVYITTLVFDKINLFLKKR